MYLWGIDIGGTKIEGVIVDDASPHVPIHRLRLPTQSAAGYEHVLGQIRIVVSDLERESGLSRPAGIGVGAPGTTDPLTGEIKNSNTICLNGRTLRRDLETSLGASVFIANDANCFALAEARMGSGKGLPIVLGLIVGTGCGGGIVVHGKVLQGLQGLSGEWGHNPVGDVDQLCYCGQSGCIEQVIAGPALERHYAALTGEKLGLQEVWKHACEGELAAISVFEHLREKFAQAIAPLINVIDPDAIVVGGGVGKLPVFYDDNTRQRVASRVFNLGDLRTQILQPELGDSAGVFGAALLCVERL